MSWNYGKVKLQKLQDCRNFFKLILQIVIPFIITKRWNIPINKLYYSYICLNVQKPASLFVDLIGFHIFALLMQMLNAIAYVWWKITSKFSHESGSRKAHTHWKMDSRADAVDWSATTWLSRWKGGKVGWRVSRQANTGWWTSWRDTLADGRVNPCKRAIG